jgi:hypothetical protein
MVISDYQISSVIKTYMRNMKGRTTELSAVPEPVSEDKVTISDEGVRKMLFDRIGEKITERLRKHDRQE